MPLPPDGPDAAHAPLVVQRVAPRQSASALENGSYYGESGEPMGPGSLLEYWHILRRRKGAVILITFCGAALGILVTLPQTPVYQARTSLEIQDLNENFLNMKEVTPESQAYNALSDIQTQIKILQSATLTGRTVKKLKIGSPEGLKQPESRINVWRRALNLPEPTPVDARDALLAAAGKSLKVRAAGQTRIIEVLVDSTDPKLASNFANTLTNEFIDQNMEARWKMTQRTGDWLSRQMDDMRVKLERSEDALQSYARENGLLFTGSAEKDQTNVSEDKLKQLQTELGAAQADRIAKQSRYEMAQSSPPESLADVLNDASLRDYQSKITDLRRARAELETTYTADHPKVKRVAAQIDALTAAFQRERSNIIKRIYNDFLEAQRRENLLATAYAEQSKIVSGEGEKSIQYHILKREVDSNRQLYEAMLQKVKESSIAAAMKASNIRVIDPAEAPKYPYKPSAAVNTALGLFAGCVLGIAFVVMRDRADRTFQSPGDAAYWLKTPELGAIPGAHAAARRRLYYYRPACVSESSGNLPVKVDSPDCVELASVQHRDSVVAESFRAVLTSLIFTGYNGSRPRVLVMTSSGPAEGKTTVASNLAIALAEIGSRVLLIDADMRKPRIHDIFGIPNETGLSTLLRERSPVAESGLSAFIHETTLSGLNVLPSGPPTSGATTLLYSPRFGELIKQIRREYEMILIDTPPMSHMPDARVAARSADGVALIIRCGTTTRDAAISVQKTLMHDNTRVIGTILNDWDPRKSSNSYYGGYYKGYNYNSYNTSNGRHEKPQGNATSV